MTGRQLAFDLGQRPALGREDFLVADSNRAAVAWLDRWPDWPGPALVLYGPAGSGKSHLAQVWRQRARAPQVVAADLAEPMLLALASTGAVVEDADQGSDSRALLHLHNLVAEHGRHLLLTARTPPARWQIGLADLASRLRAAPAVPLGSPDEALIGAVLVKLFADRQLKVKAEVVAYLLGRMERSFAAARRLVAAIDAAALAERRRIDVVLVRRILSESVTDA